MCFYFKGDNKFSKDVGFNSNIKDSYVKNGVENRKSECKCSEGGANYENKKLMIQSFIEAVSGGDELKDSVAVYYVLLFLYLFCFFLVYDT